MRHQYGEQRGHGIDDRGKSGTDVTLSVNDQAEGNGIVDQSHAEQGQPNGFALWKSGAC